MTSVLALLGLLAVAAAIGIGGWVSMRRPALMKVPAQGASLAGLTIINPGEEPIRGQTIVVRGGTIEAIIPTRAGEADQSDRFAGCYAVPGLIDIHVHSPPPNGAEFAYFMLMYLSYGVTAVRDAGISIGGMSTLRALHRARDRIAAGTLAGPRVFSSGIIIDGPEPVWPASLVVRNVEEANRAVDAMASMGVDFIKVYERLDRASLAAVERAADRHRLPLLGHVPNGIPFEDVHIPEVQHLMGFTDIPDDVGSHFADRMKARAQAWEAVDEARINQVVQTSMRQHLSHTPTIVVTDRTSRLYDFEAALRDPVANLMPRWDRVFWRARTKGVPPDTYRALNAQIPKMKRIVKTLHEADVPILVGTDVMNAFVVPGASLHEEMQNLIDAGFTPEESLAAATQTNGTALPLAGLGHLRVGAPADFVLLKEDPSRDLKGLRSPRAVVANGRLYAREDLDAALGRYRRRFGSPVYEFAMTMIMWAFARVTQDNC